MLKKIVCLLLLLYPTHYFAQSPDFHLLMIPDSLKKSAVVIKHTEDILFEVTDVDKAYLTAHKTFTVLNAKGKNALMFAKYSNGAIKLVNAEIRVFDAAGNQTGKYKMNDMYTSAVGEGLVEDGQATYFEIPALAYPLTVDIKYEVRYKGTLFYPNYEIQSSSESVENSSFTVKIPADLDLRFKSKNINIKPEITTADKYKLYKWSVKNLAALAYEEGTVNYRGRYPQIILAPNKFKIYESEGDMSSWKMFGSWEYELTKGLYDLSPERIAFFNGLVKDAKNDRDKIKIIYEYLQKNFRYVSIQLGIGGFKPFPASFTDQKKYGDCKGLSFYVHAVLKSIGIKSYVALINAGYNEEPVDPLFPCNQFDHMILCVPSQKDSTWLECTSPTADFAVLSNFTENRYALLITENGGELVKTPLSKFSDNIFNSKTIATFDENGAGNATMKISLKGYFKSLYFNYLEEKKDEQKQYLVNEVGLKQPDDFEMTKEELGNNLGGKVELLIEKIPAFSAGSKIFLNKHLYQFNKITLPTAENRRLDYFFKCPYEKSDTIIYKIPAGYVPDVLPATKTISDKYCSYTTNCWFDEKEQSVYSVAITRLTSYRIPAVDYASFKKTYDEIIKDESQHIVIKKL